MSTDPREEPLRPRALALLLLATTERLPRERARDQQADLAGLLLMRRVLDRLAALDPEPDALEAALAQIVQELSPPSGPVRAMATLVRDEWRYACATPEWVAHLLAEAVRSPERRREEKTS
jgi:hypothetical protein